MLTLVEHLVRCRESLVNFDWENLVTGRVHLILHAHSVILVMQTLLCSFRTRFVSVGVILVSFGLNLLFYAFLVCGVFVDVCMFLTHLFVTFLFLCQPSW